MKERLNNKREYGYLRHEKPEEKKEKNLEDERGKQV